MRPLWALTFRFAVSDAIAVGVAQALGQDWRLTGPATRSVEVFGLRQNALYLGLNFMALQWVEASLAAIMASARPLIAAMAHQLLVPGLVASLSWLTLARRVGAIRASNFHFLNPFFGVTVGVVLLAEHVSATDSAGVVIAMAGIMAVQLLRQAASKAAS